MTRRPIIVLDLYCCAGGAGKGYLAVADIVIGVDISPQPRYAGTYFQQADCITFLTELVELGFTWVDGYGELRLKDVTFIHASPPCQARSDLQKQSKIVYRELVPPTRRLLRLTNLPYVIENVEGEAEDPEAMLINPVRLCGANDDYFPELRVIRHRLFESNVPLVGVPCPPKHPLCFTMDKRKSSYIAEPIARARARDEGDHYFHVNGGGNCTVANKRRALGTPWMTGKECNEAIPPAYATFIGKQVMAYIEAQSHPTQQEVTIG